MSMDAGLVGHWKFNEKSGIIANDSSRYRNTGTLVGATHLPVWVEKGIKFDGVDDYVSSSSILSNYTIGEYTVSVWVNPLNTTLGNIFGAGTGVTTNRFAMIVVSGNLRVGVYNGLAIGYKSGNLLENKWQHIVYIFNNSIGSLYIDNVIQIGTNSPSTTNANAFNIGSAATGINFYNGSIDEVRIYNRALSASEIKRNYEATKHNYI